MKTLKTLLAWLDWSTYCRSDSGSTWTTNYKYPKSLCSLFWRTGFSLLALIPVWFIHPWNFFVIGKESFRNENTSDYKLNFLNGIIVHFLVMFSASGAYSIIEDKLGFDWYSFSDPVLLSYFKVVAGGLAVIIGGIIALVVFIFVCYLIHLLFKKITGSQSHESSAVARTVDSIKNKYCPEINWDSVRNKNKI